MKKTTSWPLILLTWQLSSLKVTTIDLKDGKEYFKQGEVSYNCLISEKEDSKEKLIIRDIEGDFKFIKSPFTKGTLQILNIDTPNTGS